jgi:hypothetical protein
MSKEAASTASALEALRVEMTKAKGEFASSSAAHDKRVAAIRLLLATQDVIASMGCETQPLWVLIDGLMQLNSGDTPPLFQKSAKPAGGRAPTGLLRGSLEGFTLGIVHAMIVCGERPVTARSRAAKVLQNAGVRAASGTGNITARTIQTWGEKASTNRKSVAAKVLGRFPPSRKPDDPQSEINRLLHSLEVVASQSLKTR